MSYRYFELEDFRCRCGCGGNEIEPWFVQVLDNLREKIGRPMIISSGWRCVKHDKSYGGKGNHVTGLAADIITPDSNMRFNFIYYARDFDIHRIGLAHLYTHLDVIHAGAPQEVAWLY